jgi:integrase
MNIVNAVDQKEIALITALLQKDFSPIFSDVWQFGLNASLRISDLLTIEFDHCDTAKRILILTESKTKKTKEIRLNDKALAVIEKRRKENPTHNFLFEVDSRRAKGVAISRESVARAFKSVGDRLGLKVSTHTMRKSRGKAMFDAGVSLEQISKVLNHSNTSSTLRYIGITREQTLQTFDDFQL